MGWSSCSRLCTLGYGRRGCAFGGTITVEIYKRYNWGNISGGKHRGDLQIPIPSQVPVVGGNTIGTLSQNDLAHLNTVGLAQDYDVVVSGRGLMSKMANKWIFIAPVAIVAIAVCIVSVYGWWGRGHDEPVYANAIAGTSTDISLKDVLLSHRLTLPLDATDTRYAARAHSDADSPLTLDFNSACASSQALAQSIAPRLGGEADMPNSKLIGFAQSEGWIPSGTDEWYAKLSDKEEVQALIVHRPGGDCTTYIASFISLGS